MNVKLDVSYKVWCRFKRALKFVALVVLSDKPRPEQVWEIFSCANEFRVLISYRFRGTSMTKVWVKESIKYYVADQNKSILRTRCTQFAY
jgi:hypothetical protein